MSRERCFEDENRIVDAAIALICETGYEHFSTRHLASRLGISPMTLYNYFSNKEEIVKVTIAAAHEKVLRFLQGQLKPHFESTSENPLRGYLEMGRVLLSYSKRCPKMYALVFIMNSELSIDESKLVELYTFGYRKIEERVKERNVAEELHQHINLFEILVSALVRNIHNKNGPTDEATFEANLQIAYEKLLKPFETYIM